jgi:hypothetical protein
MSNQPIKLTGIIKYIDLGMGAWALVTSSGEQYELLQPAPAELLKEGIQVVVTGEIRDDVMTIAAIGPVLDVKQFQAM